MPKLHEITERVLSSEDIKTDKDVREFLYRLKAEIEEYYKKHKFKSDINYEDLYYMARQISDSESGEYANPAVQPLVDKIRDEIKHLLEKTDHPNELLLHDLAAQAMEHIENVVCESLNENKELKPLDYLECIKEACEDESFSRVDIFTLNHDTVLEKYLGRYLNQNKIRFTYGFFKPEGEENRYWNPRLFNSKFFKIRLFKLHGSINWYRFRPQDAKDWGDDLFGIPSSSNRVGLQIKDAKDRMLFIYKRPMLLVGTYNKMLEYHSGIYTELHYQ